MTKISNTHALAIRMTMNTGLGSKRARWVRQYMKQTRRNRLAISGKNRPIKQFRVKSKGKPMSKQAYIWLSDKQLILQRAKLAMNEYRDDEDFDEENPLLASMAEMYEELEGYIGHSAAWIVELAGDGYGQVGDKHNAALINSMAKDQNFFLIFPALESDYVVIDINGKILYVGDNHSQAQTITEETNNVL